MYHVQPASLTAQSLSFLICKVGKWRPPRPPRAQEPGRSRADARTSRGVPVSSHQRTGADLELPWRTLCRASGGRSHSGNQGNGGSPFRAWTAPAQEPSCGKG